MRLNIACGNNKIEGYENIDVEKSCNPDRVVDIQKGLPYESDSVEEILFFHAIEHIPKANHVAILKEFWRALVPGGELIITYPEFEKIARNWLDNYRGQRDFWEATVYGLQRYPSDFHVALMHTPEFIERLTAVGFGDFKTSVESKEEWNTVLYCRKAKPQTTYEEILRREIF